MNILALAINFKGFTLETLYCEQMALRAAVKAGGGHLEFCGPGFEYHSNDISCVVARLTKEGKRPDLIISFLSENLFFGPLSDSVQKRYSLSGDLVMFPRGLEKVKGIPKVIWINDFWHMSQEDWDRTVLDHGFRYVISPYCPPFLRENDFRLTYSENLRKHIKFIPIPRGINAELFRDYDEERTVDVTLLGAMGDFYQLRNYFHQSLRSQSWLKYFTHPHPGYDFDTKGACVGEDYAQSLARSKVFVSCTGRYGLPFIKIFEVLASGALLMCDKPSGSEQLGLIDGETYVEVNKSNFMQKLKYYLSHPEELTRVSAAGQALFLAEYTVEHSATRFINAFISIIEDNAVAVNGEICSGVENRVPDTDTCSTLRTLALTAKQLLYRPARWLMGTDDTSKSLPCDNSVADTLNTLTNCSLWEDDKGGTFLDWARVSESKHVLEICQIDSLRELELIEKFGLNAHWGANPVITQHAETVFARPKALQLLAQTINAKLICEIGTARGLQAVFWAQYLSRTHSQSGAIYTCDIIGHDEPLFRTPLSAQAIWTRRELWASEPVASKIHFVHGTSATLSESLKSSIQPDRRVDLLYIDAAHDEESVMADYENMRDILAEKAVLIFDDCDPRFSGVESAVNRIAKERDSSIQLLTFWPCLYSIAIIGNCMSLDSLKIRK